VSSEFGKGTAWEYSAKRPSLLQKSLAVIPAEAGIQSLQSFLDPGLRRGDGTCKFCKSLGPSAIFAEREERVLNRFASTNRTFSRFFEPLSFLEQEPAVVALGRFCDQLAVSFLKRSSDMFQVLVDFSFGNADHHGNISGREHAAVQQHGDDFPPRRVAFFAGHRGAFGFHR